MPDLRLLAKFKKGCIRCRKRRYDMRMLQSVVHILRIPVPLPPVKKDHPPGGDWTGSREYHIKGDWLLIFIMLLETNRDLTIQVLR